MVSIERMSPVGPYSALHARLGKSRPFALVAGLNVIESYEAMKRTAARLQEITTRLGIDGFVFKASFDKANRSNEGAFRGPGVEAGLEQLARLRKELNVPIVTDVHENHQCDMVKTAELDMIQIPAFLCRQTDLIHRAADIGLPVLIKKGLFRKRLLSRLFPN